MADERAASKGMAASRRAHAAVSHSHEATAHRAKRASHARDRMSGKGGRTGATAAENFAPCCDFLHGVPRDPSLARAAQSSIRGKNGHRRVAA